MTEREKSNLKEIDALIRRKNDLPAPLNSANPSALAGLEKRSDEIRSQKLGIFGEFRANKIERSAAIQQLRMIHNTRLEAAKFALEKGIQVEKERIQLIADKYLYQITEEYLRDMQEMGVSNLKARLDTLFTLNDETTKALTKAQSAQWPETLKMRTIDGIMKKYQEFSDKLMADDKRA